MLIKRKSRPEKGFRGSGQFLLAKNANSVPSTHTGWLTSPVNPSSKDVKMPPMDICTHVIYKAKNLAPAKLQFTQHRSAAGLQN